MNPPHSTMNPPHSTMNPPHSTMNPPHSTMNPPDAIGKWWATLQQLLFHLTITITLKFNLQDRDRPMKKKLL
jgi:hypothetical protein